MEHSPLYSPSVENIKNTFLILSCTLPFALRTASISSGRGVYNVSKVFHGPMLTPMLPIVVSSWLNDLFGGGTILDTHGKLLSVKKSGVAVFDTLKLVCLAPYPVQRHFNLLSCPFTL
jgi:hypothetical protein